jgi:hypothetical protein
MDTTSSNVQVMLCATLEGHKDSVTSIATPSDPTQNFIVTGSRGKLANTMDGWVHLGYPYQDICQSNPHQYLKPSSIITLYPLNNHLNQDLIDHPIRDHTNLMMALYKDPN